LDVNITFDKLLTDGISRKQLVVAGVGRKYIDIRNSGANNSRVYRGWAWRGESPPKKNAKACTIIRPRGKAAQKSGAAETEAEKKKRNVRVNVGDVLMFDGYKSVSIEDLQRAEQAVLFMVVENAPIVVDDGSESASTFDDGVMDGVMDGVSDNLITSSASAPPSPHPTHNFKVGDQVLLLKPIKPFDPTTTSRCWPDKNLSVSLTSDGSDSSNGDPEVSERAERGGGVEEEELSSFRATTELHFIPINLLLTFFARRRSTNFCSASLERGQ